MSDNRVAGDAERIAELERGIAHWTDKAYKLLSRAEDAEAALRAEREKVAKLTRLVESACKTTEAGSPVKYGEYSECGKYIPPAELPNIPDLEAERDSLRADYEKVYGWYTSVQEQLAAEKQARAEAVGLLADAAEELRLLRMKDTVTVYDPTLRARIAIAIDAARAEPTGEGD